MDIARVKGKAVGRSRGSAYGDLVTAVAVDPSAAPSVAEQTRSTLAQLDGILAELGSDKSRIVQATVYMADLNRKAEMEVEWVKWIGTDPKAWPQRACVGVQLMPTDLVEIVVVAARKVA
ncbi:MAG: Rid family hydrolase [Alphaproteobacteria bacterium]